jgi:hypothetical protein
MSVFHLRSSSHQKSAAETIFPGAAIVHSSLDDMLHLGSANTISADVSFQGFCIEDVIRLAGELVTFANVGVLFSEDWTSVTGAQFLTEGEYYFLSSTSGMISPVAPTSGAILCAGLAIDTRNLHIATFARQTLMLDSTFGTPVSIDQAGGGVFIPVNGLSVGPATPLTIVGNTVTATRGWHSLLADGSAAQRKLQTINGLNLGRMVVLSRDASSPGSPVIDSGVGNIRGTGQTSLDSLDEKIMLIFDGINWCNFV